MDSHQKALIKTGIMALEERMDHDALAIYGYIIEKGWDETIEEIFGLFCEGYWGEDPSFRAMDLADKILSLHGAE